MKIFVYLLIAAVLVVGLFFVLKPKQSATPSTNSESLVSPKDFALVVQNKKLVSGPEILQVNQGDEVNITITSDVVEELHLHGYDKSVDLEKDKPATLSFKADISGRFVYELEDSKVDIGVLEVLPK
jgi:plastocyanin